MSRFVVCAGTQFLLGLTTYVMYFTSSCLLLEMTTGKYATIVSNINLYMYVAGELIVLLVAYLTRDWNTLNVVMSVYSCVLVIAVAVVLPESPRFLAEKKRFAEAAKILSRVGRINGKLRKGHTLTDTELIAKLKTVPMVTVDSARVNVEGRKENDPLLEIYSSVTQPTYEAVKVAEERAAPVSALKFLMNPGSNLIKTIFFCFIWIA